MITNNEIAPTFEEFEEAIIKELPYFIKAVQKDCNGPSAETYVKTIQHDHVKTTYDSNVKKFNEGFITREYFLSTGVMSIVEFFSLMYPD